MFIPVLQEEQQARVEALAGEIWTEHYTPIIGREQVEYMLARFQSKQSIAGQVEDGMLYYLLREHDDDIGYLAVQPKGDELFLSKIYIRSVERGRGRGRNAVRFIETLAKERRLQKITLTVNKNNLASIEAYKKIGFAIAGSLVQDIGNGFVMDDYRMEKAVS